MGTKAIDQIAETQDSRPQGKAHGLSHQGNIITMVFENHAMHWEKG